MIDPKNPVVKLCSEGMVKEAASQPEEALALYLQAWDLCHDDYDACLVAHYVARHQKNAEDTLHWNSLALQKADLVGDERVAAFYPSLYLCVGKSHEDLGDLKEAKRNYLLAKDRVGVLPEGPYGDVVRGGLEAALQRINGI